MNRASRRYKTPAKLTDSTQQRLNMYAIAACAAGLGVLALTQPAEAKIIYTPTHQRVTLTNWVHIDLNHDGINDFVLENQYLDDSVFVTYYLRCYSENHGYKNRVRGKSVPSFSASALRAGVRIGPGKKFPRIAPNMALVAQNTQNHSATTFRWPWANDGKGVKSHYLGLEFFVKGKAHFGWARVDVSFTARHSIDAVLTGYAYETIPGKSIVAGATKGPSEIHNSDEQPKPVAFPAPTHKSAPLGLLAIGAPGLSVWRREELADAKSQAH
jgi:hypothetical protein